jgi:hypothetical protein
VHLCGIFLPKTSNSDAQCKLSLKIPTGSTTTLIQHLAKHPHQNRECWKQKEMTSKKGTKQT